MNNLLVRLQSKQRVIGSLFHTSTVYKDLVLKIRKHLLNINLDKFANCSMIRKACKFTGRLLLLKEVLYNTICQSPVIYGDNLWTSGLYVYIAMSPPTPRQILKPSSAFTRRHEFLKLRYDDCASGRCTCAWS